MNPQFDFETYSPFEDDLCTLTTPTTPSSFSQKSNFSNLMNINNNNNINVISPNEDENENENENESFVPNSPPEFFSFEDSMNNDDILSSSTSSSISIFDEIENLNQFKKQKKQQQNFNNLTEKKKRRKTLPLPLKKKKIERRSNSFSNLLEEISQFNCNSREEQNSTICQNNSISLNPNFNYFTKISVLKNKNENIINQVKNNETMSSVNPHNLETYMKHAKESSDFYSSKFPEFLLCLPYKYDFKIYGKIPGEEEEEDSDDDNDGEDHKKNKKKRKKNKMNGFELKLVHPSSKKENYKIPKLSEKVTERKKLEQKENPSGIAIDFVETISSNERVIRFSTIFCSFHFRKLPFVLHLSYKGKEIWVSKPFKTYSRKAIGTTQNHNQNKFHFENFLKAQKRRFNFTFKDDSYSNHHNNNNNNNNGFIFNNNNNKNNIVNKNKYCPFNQRKSIKRAGYVRGVNRFHPYGRKFNNSQFKWSENGENRNDIFEPKIYPSNPIGQNSNFPILYSCNSQNNSQLDQQNVFNFNNNQGSQVPPHILQNILQQLKQNTKNDVLIQTSNNNNNNNNNNNKNNNNNNNLKFNPIKNKEDTVYFQKKNEYPKIYPKIPNSQMRKVSMQYLVIPFFG